MPDTPARTNGSVARVTERTKPTLVKVGKRTVISSFRWNNDCVADYLLDHRNKWLSMGDLSKVAYGQTTLKGKQRARHKLSKLAHVLAGRGEVLIIEYGDHNRAQSAKVADFESEQDRQSALVRLDAMQSRRDVSEATYAKFKALIEPKFESIQPTSA